MLRDFTTSADGYDINCFLSNFKITNAKYHEFGYVDFTLLGFNVIKPDSFIWKLIINYELYYLYAEDYVISLEQVINTVKDYDKTLTKLEFVKVYNPKKHEKIEPRKKGVIYSEPDKVNSIRLYTVDSGHDHAFLLRTGKSISDAYFSR